MTAKRVVSDGPVATWPREGLAPDIDGDDISPAGARPRDTPERALLRAILENAIREARGAITCSSATRRQEAELYDEAYTYLHRRGGRSQYGTAAYICEVLEIDQSWLLREFRKHPLRRFRFQVSSRRRRS